jgi:hypothetical protein
LLAALRMPELRGFDWQHMDEQQVYRQLLAERTPRMRRRHAMKPIMYWAGYGGWWCTCSSMHRCRCSRPGPIAARTGSTVAIRRSPMA